MLALVNWVNNLVALSKFETQQALTIIPKVADVSIESLVQVFNV